MGGVPAETPMVSGAAPTKAPFIGCLRDVLIEKDIVDFNSVIYHTGVEMNTCSVETVESGTSLGSDDTIGMYSVHCTLSLVLCGQPMTSWSTCPFIFLIDIYSFIP